MYLLLHCPCNVHVTLPVLYLVHVMDIFYSVGKCFNLGDTNTQSLNMCVCVCTHACGMLIFLYWVGILNLSKTKHFNFGLSLSTKIELCSVTCIM